MVHTSHESKWNKTIKTFLDKKRALRLDAWGAHPSKECSEVIDPLVKWIDANVPNAKTTYPSVRILRAIVVELADVPLL